MAARAPFRDPDAFRVGGQREARDADVRKRRRGDAEEIFREGGHPGRQRPFHAAQAHARHREGRGSAADVMNIAGHSSLASSSVYTMMFGSELEGRYRQLLGKG